MDRYGYISLSNMAAVKSNVYKVQTIIEAAAANPDDFIVIEERKGSKPGAQGSIFLDVKMKCKKDKETGVWTHIKSHVGWKKTDKPLINLSSLDDDKTKNKFGYALCFDKNGMDPDFWKAINIINDAWLKAVEVAESTQVIDLGKRERTPFVLLTYGESCPDRAKRGKPNPNPKWYPKLRFDKWPSGDLKCKVYDAKNKPKSLVEIDPAVISKHIRSGEEVSMLILDLTSCCIATRQISLPNNIAEVDIDFTNGGKTTYGGDFAVDDDDEVPAPAPKAPVVDEEEGDFSDDDEAPKSPAPPKTPAPAKVAAAPAKAAPAATPKAAKPPAKKETLASKMATLTTDADDYANSM